MKPTFRPAASSPRTLSFSGGGSDRSNTWQAIDNLVTQMAGEVLGIERAIAEYGRLLHMPGFDRRSDPGVLNQMRLEASDRFTAKRRQLNALLTHLERGNLSEAEKKRVAQTFSAIQSLSETFILGQDDALYRIR